MEEVDLKFYEEDKGAEYYGRYGYGKGSKRATDCETEG